MNVLVEYAPYLLTALVMTTLMAAWAAPKGMRERTARDAFFLNLTTHPAAAAVAIYLPGGAFLGTELAFIVAHAGWYLCVTGLTWRRAVWVSVVAGVVGQTLGSIAHVGLYLAWILLVGR